MTSSELLESKLLDAPAPKRTKARGDVFYLVMAIVVAAVVTIGFAPNLDARLLHPSSPRPAILYLHVAVSISWVLLFIAQAALVRTRRVAWHRRLGLGGLVVGTLLPPLDVVVTRSIHRVYRYALPILILGQAIAMWIYLSRAPAWIAAVRPLLT